MAEISHFQCKSERNSSVHVVHEELERWTKLKSYRVFTKMIRLWMKCRCGMDCSIRGFDGAVRPCRAPKPVGCSLDKCQGEEGSNSNCLTATTGLYGSLRWWRWVCQTRVLLILGVEGWLLQEVGWGSLCLSATYVGWGCKLFGSFNYYHLRAAVGPIISSGVLTLDQHIIAYCCASNTWQWPTVANGCFHSPFKEVGMNFFIIHHLNASTNLIRRHFRKELGL